MRAHTNTSTVVYHEDGSWTETNEITHYPATTAQKATGLLVLGAVVVAPLVPVLTVVSMEKAVELKDKYRNKRAAKKALKSVN
jgi:hypothetical protein